MDTKSITISSGKGGVGKSCSSVNLAVLLAQHGYETCLLDADANLANINIMLKLVPEFTLEHVISGEKTLAEITLYKDGIEIVPGYSGLSDFISLTTEQRQRLIKALQQLKSKYDYLLIDNPAGISKTVLSFIKFSSINIIVITAEPTSLTDAFSLIRVASKSTGQKNFQILINKVKNKQQADSIFKRFSMAVEKHIGFPVEYLGHVISDELVTSSICTQNPVILEHPKSAASYCFEDICRSLLSLQTFSSSKKRLPITAQAEAPSTDQTDFSGHVCTDRFNNQPASAKKIHSVELLQKEMLQLISDESQPQEILKQAVVKINTAYSDRFGDTENNLSSDLFKNIDNTTLPEPSLRNLIMTLHSQYQDQYGSFSVKAPSHSSQSATENSFTEKSLDHVIKLLQKEKLSHLQQLINQDSQSPQLPLAEEEIKPNKQSELLDSLKYAALTDS